MVDRDRSGRRTESSANEEYFIVSSDSEWGREEPLQVSKAAQTAQSRVSVLRPRLSDASSQTDFEPGISRHSQKDGEIFLYVGVMMTSDFHRC